MNVTSLLCAHSSDSALESGSKQLSKQKWRKKRANNEGELSSLDELTDGSLDCGHRDKGSTSTQGRCTGTRKREGACVMISICSCVHTSTQH